MYVFMCVCMCVFRSLTGQFLRLRVIYGAISIIVITLTLFWKENVNDFYSIIAFINVVFINVVFPTLSLITKYSIQYSTIGKKYHIIWCNFNAASYKFDMHQRYYFIAPFVNKLDSYVTSNTVTENSCTDIIAITELFKMVYWSCALCC